MHSRTHTYAQDIVADYEFQDLPCSSRAAVAARPSSREPFCDSFRAVNSTNNNYMFIQQHTLTKTSVMDMFACTSPLILVLQCSVTGCVQTLTMCV